MELIRASAQLSWFAVKS